MAIQVAFYLPPRFDVWIAKYYIANVTNTFFTGRSRCAWNRSIGENICCKHPDEDFDETLLGYVGDVTSRYANHMRILGMLWERMSFRFVMRSY